MHQGFFRQNERFIQSLLKLTDAFAVLLAFILAHYIRFGDLFISPERLIVIILTLLLMQLVFSWSGVYRQWRGSSLSLELSAIVIGLLLVIFILAFCGYITKSGGLISRIWLAEAFLFSLVFLFSLRFAIRFSASWVRSRGFNYRSVLIVGAGDLGVAVAKKLSLNPEAGVKVVGFLDDNPELTGCDVEGIAVLGRSSDVHEIVEQRRQSGDSIDFVWIALPVHARDTVISIMESLEDSATSVSVVPDMFALQLATGTLDDIADIPLINFSQPRIVGFQSLLKSSLDYSLAFMFLMLFFPLILILSVLIKFDSKGPVFFFQRRYGMDGKEIYVCKFRTMLVQEDGDSVKQAQRHDSRVTGLGRFLRKSSLDEIPQFFNVLQGTMSIVGPRPHAVSHNEIYRKRIKGYMTRHKIKPGITGLAQVSGCRGETETDSKMQKRVEYDLKYMGRWSIWLDIQIIVKTAVQLLFPKNVY